MKNLYKFLFEDLHVFVQILAILAFITSTILFSLGLYHFLMAADDIAKPIIYTILLLMVITIEISCFIYYKKYYIPHGPAYSQIEEKN